MSLWQEHVPCEGWLYHVWIPETLAHVYHSDAWHDQPNFVYRYACVYRNANFFLLPIFHCQSLLISYSLSLPNYLLDCHLVMQIVRARVWTKTSYTVRSHRSSSFPWSQVSANAIAVGFRGEKFHSVPPQLHVCYRPTLAEWVENAGNQRKRVISHRQQYFGPWTVPSAVWGKCQFPFSLPSVCLTAGRGDMFRSEGEVFPVLLCCFFYLFSLCCSALVWQINVDFFFFDLQHFSVFF